MSFTGTGVFTGVVLSLGIQTMALAQEAGKPAGAPAESKATPPISMKAIPPATTIKFKMETFVKGVEVPWDMVFTSKDRMIFTERAGRVRQVVKGQLRNEPLVTIDNVASGRGENGLLGICLHPDYQDNKFVYVAYGFKGQGEPNDVRVVRYTDTGSKLESPTLIIKGFPFGANHAGCSVRFGPDGKLYISTGEAFKKQLAKDMTSLGGKILRINGDGTVPSDNPFVGSEHKAKGVRPEIWSFGHRNPQGIDWQAGTNELFSTEHGPSVSDAPGGGDEFNHVRKGHDMGWPGVHHAQTNDTSDPPLVEYTPAVAPASGVFYNGDLFPELKGAFLSGFLRGNALVAFYVDGDKLVKQETLIKDLGRIRPVIVGPDGAIYFATSNRDGRGRAADEDDRIFRLVPAGTEDAKPEVPAKTPATPTPSKQ